MPTSKRRSRSKVRTVLLLAACILVASQAASQVAEPLPDRVAVDDSSHDRVELGEPSHDRPALGELAGDGPTRAESASAGGAGAALSTDSVLVPSGRTFELSGRYRLLGTDEYLDLASLRGKTVLMDFWASWCRPCIQEIPEANAFADRLASRQDVAFVSVNQDELTGGQGVEAVRRLVNEKGIVYPVLLDSRDESLKNRLKVRAWPTKVMIDPDGKILMPPSGRMTFALAAEYLRLHRPSDAEADR